jgi:hypothetical protein
MDIFARGYSETQLASYPFGQMIKISVAEREFQAMPYTLRLHLALPFKSGESVATPLAKAWQDAVLDAGEVCSGGKELALYLCCDDQARFEAWKSFISSHIGAYRAFSG